MMPLQLGVDAGRPGTFLFLGAHCDDIEIGCGASVLRLVDEHPEAAFHWVVFSSDERRAAETKRAATVLLAKARESKVVIKQFRNAFFPFIGAELKEYFEELKRSVTPDAVFTHHRQDRHQDHRTLSDLTWNTFRSHLVLEYEIPKYDGDLGQPNLFVPVTKAMMERKIETLMACYATQTNHQWFTPDTFAGLMRLRGIECDSPTGYAEAFHARKMIL
ncbi:MAG: PIG-L family deacetylase [Alphaproteobacteria bacterium]|nr:PIG-L family deacetylase [Alphaproteobacteria bacterium]